MPLDQTEAPPHLPFHPHLAATPAAFSHSPLWAISKIYPFSLPALEFRVTLIVNSLHVNLQNSWVQHKDYRNAIASPQTQRKVPFRQHKRPCLQIWGEAETEEQQNMNLGWLLRGNDIRWISNLHDIIVSHSLVHPTLIIPSEICEILCRLKTYPCFLQNKTTSSSKTRLGNGYKDSDPSFIKSHPKPQTRKEQQQNNTPQ
jgi:hypothetical protein